MDIRVTGDLAGPIRQQCSFDNPLEWFSIGIVLTGLLADKLNHLAMIAFTPCGLESLNRLDSLGYDLGFDRLRRRMLKNRVARFELERP
jgi:hypothetical protein